MNLADDLTVLILTYDEESNIARALEAVGWASTILLVDSGSTDKTLEIAGGYSQCAIVTRRFDTFANQCNFGLAQVKTKWVLSLDADYELTPELQKEICSLKPDKTISGYQTSFIYCVNGAPLRATLYPARTTLYRREKARYVDEGHGHRVFIKGRVEQLQGRIRHDDRKPLDRWIGSQQKYAVAEADYLLSTPRSCLKRADHLRLMGWPAPILAFLYTLIWKGCILDGWRGWFYVLQRTIAEMIIALEIINRRLLSR